MCVCVCVFKAPRRKSIGKTHSISEQLKKEYQETFSIMACEPAVGPAWNLHGHSCAVVGKFPIYLLAPMSPSHCWAGTGPSTSEGPSFQAVVEKRINRSAQLSMCYFACVPSNAGAGPFVSELPEHVLIWHLSL